ncbi:MAG: hypothetical protein MUF54_12670 [Polyangiaceae bacterium]|nr:hypothetical protein [Polyangiaceae bacterium]
MVKLWNSSDAGGYIFELNDEAHKENEAEGMDFELEPHFGLFELLPSHSGKIDYDSNLSPKFKVDFFAKP